MNWIREITGSNISNGYGEYRKTHALQLQPIRFVLACLIRRFVIQYLGFILLRGSGTTALVK